MTQQQTQEQVISQYVQMLLEDTRMAELPEEERAVWEKQLTASMQKAVTIALINALQPDQRKSFESHLADKEIGKALKVLVDGNPDYVDKMKHILSQYNKSFLEKYEEELKKQK